MRFRDYDKYGSALPLPAHLFRMLKWKIASVFGKDHGCIHCWEFRASGKIALRASVGTSYRKNCFLNPMDFLLGIFLPTKGLILGGPQKSIIEQNHRL